MTNFYYRSSILKAKERWFMLPTLLKSIRNDNAVIYIDRTCLAHCRLWNDEGAFCKDPEETSIALISFGG